MYEICQSSLLFQHYDLRSRGFSLSYRFANNLHTLFHHHLIHIGFLFDIQGETGDVRTILYQSSLLRFRTILTTLYKDISHQCVRRDSKIIPGS